MLRNLRYFLLVFGLICALFYAWQHRLFFHPKAIDPSRDYFFGKGKPYITSVIDFDASTRIEVVKFRLSDSTRVPKGIVLFFHGNKENVEYYSPYAGYFTKNGYEVWMPDYPGYGRSTGELDEEILEQLPIQLYKMARVTFSPDQIVVYGKSLGTGLASYLSAKRDCRQLILETPYYSLSSLSQTYAWFLPVPLLIRFNLKSGEYFNEINCPITVLAAGEDEVIPLQNTLRLLPAMKNTDAFYLVKGAGHNDIKGLPVYSKVVDSVLAK